MRLQLPKQDVWPIEKLQEWDKNPRDISPAGLERIKYQVKHQVQYKPLVVTPAGIVLGGNMRLRVYKQLGVEEVWVSIVEPKNEGDMLEINLSDNDHGGWYVVNKLVNDFRNVQIDTSQYSVDVQEGTNYGVVLKSFEVPTNLVGQEVSRPPRLIITFQSIEDLQNAKAEIEQILKKYAKSFMSVSAGEI